MKYIFLFFFLAIGFTSCLKDSIADAMLKKERNSNTNNSITATMSYKVNGVLVQQSLNNPGNQNTNNYDLGCKKTLYYGTTNGIYSLQCITPSRDIGYIFFTDSLKVGNYSYTGINGDMYIFGYNNRNYFVHYVSDSMSFDITSYSNGYISGNFSGRLSELVSQTSTSDIYGPPGSVLITEGSFQNVPIFFE